MIVDEKTNGKISETAIIDAIGKIHKIDTRGLKVALMADILGIIAKSN